MDVYTDGNPVTEVPYGIPGQFGTPGAYHGLPGQFEAPEETAPALERVTWGPRAVRQMQGIQETANRNQVAEMPLDEREVTLVVTGHMHEDQFVVDQIDPRNHLNPQQITAVQGSKWGRIALGIGGTMLGIILRSQGDGYNAAAYGSWAAALAMLWPSIESILIDKCKAPDPILREQYQA
ncbi:MAG: hypothetical protein LBE98_00410 [Puniceicoccales bacterium]|jgi:hypothetical protein|nr:hypothetical protein [Puniceicoccales bacterium]